MNAKLDTNHNQPDNKITSSELFHQLYKIHDTSTIDIMKFLLEGGDNQKICFRKENLIFENKSARKMSDEDKSRFHTLYENKLHDIVSDIPHQETYPEFFDYCRTEEKAAHNYRVYGYAGNGFAVCVLTVADNINTCIVYYSLNRELTEFNDGEIKKQFDQMASELNEFNESIVPVEDKIARVHMLKTSGGNLYFEDVEFEWEKHPDAEIEDFYEEDFNHMKDHVLGELNKDKNPGLVLLHGKHGTGKTTFMKLVIEESDKPVLFLPPQITKDITMPQLMDTISSTFKEPIVLVEDAEALLKKRRGDSNAMSVSNMLNLGDGILGNIYNMKFVCTFNCSIEDIDEAARRPGRLIAEYEFSDLSEERTRNLYQKLHGKDKEPPRARMSIAEIINDQEEKIVTEVKKVPFGFIQEDESESEPSEV